MKYRLLLIIPMLLLLSCGNGSGKSYLSGSYTEQLDFGFDYVKISYDTFRAHDSRYNAELYNICFNRYETLPGFDDKTISSTLLGLVINQDDLHLQAKQDVLLPNKFIQIRRSVVSIDAQGKLTSKGVLPDIKAGSIVFHNLSTAEGDPVDGNFRIVFQDNYEIRGYFKSSLEVSRAIE